MREAVRLAGYHLFESGNYIIAFLKCNIFHFNWNIIVSLSTSSSIKRKIKYLIWLLILQAIRIKGGRIVYTLHDKSFSDPAKRFTEHEKITRFILRHAYRIVIHSTESISVIKKHIPGIDTHRIAYVPHPSYITAYHSTKPYTNYVKRGNEIMLLFMGTLRRHKNIDMLIKAANQLQNITDMHVLICGSGSKNYQDQLLSEIEGTNITTDFRFIDDGELPSLLELSDALIVPYNTKSALNSGAANLAFSFGRTVIGTWTGTTRDIDESLVYCYEDTDDEEEHISRLKNAIMRFYEDFKHDKASVKTKGEKLREIMITEHSLEKVAEELSEAYA